MPEYLERMKQLKWLIALCVLCVPCLSSYGQKDNVTHVNAKYDRDHMVISYQLEEKSDISVSYTQGGSYVETPISHAFLSGDVGRRVQPGKNKVINWWLWDQFSNENRFEARDLSFLVHAKPSIRYFLAAHCGYSLDSGFNYGLSFAMVRHFGFYVKAMTTPGVPRSFSFACDAGGYVDGVLPAYTGEESVAKIYGVGGVTIRLVIPLYLMIGGGYGGRYCDWRMTDGQWVRNQARSYQDFAIDAGLMARIWDISLSFGVTMIHKTFDFSLGVGYVF